LKKLRLEAGINVPEEIITKRWYSHLKYFLRYISTAIKVKYIAV